MNRKDFLKAGLVMIGGVWGPKQQGATIIVRGPVVAPAAGGGSPALIDSTGTGGTANTVTSSAINTVGANFIVVSISYYTTLGADGDSITDSQGNTWTALTRRGTPIVSTNGQRLFYCFNPTTNAAHTFTYSDTDAYPVILVAAFSGIATSPLDQQNGTQDTGNWTTIQPGSITPSQANTVAFAGVTFDANTGATISINDSYTITNTVAISSGNHVGGSLAYKILSATTAQNPTWSSSATANDGPNSIANFKY